MVQTVIFDLGGVFISSDFGPKFFDDVIQELKIPREDLRSIMDIHEGEYQAGRMSNDVFWKHVATGLGRSEEDATRLSGLWFDRYKETTVSIPMVGLLRRLQKEGYLVAALSNTQEPHISWHKEFRDLFDAVCLSAEVGKTKPGWEIYEQFLKELKVKPEEAVFVDDSPKHLVQPREHGMHTILFQDVDQCKGKLRELGIGWDEPGYEPSFEPRGSGPENNK